MSDLFDAVLSRRSLVKVSVAAGALASMPFSLTSVGAQDKVVATMVTDTAGIGDQNFNDLAIKGGNEAAAEYGIEWKVIESVDQASYEPNLTQAAEQSQLTVAVGFKLTDALTTVAALYPDKFFLIVDSVVDAGNVRSVLFKEDQIGYLCGVVSGLSTKTNKLGIVGGERIPPVLRYEVGFVAGVKSVNESAEVIINYAGTFDDQAKGKDIAAALYNEGCDIVFPIAGLTGIGAYAAVAELNKPGELWVVGVDTAQDHLAPGYELCVGRKGVDFAVKTACADVAQGKFTPGLTTYDLKSGGIGLSLYEDRTAKSTNDLARGYEKAVLDGTIVPPTTDDELKAFVVPPQPEPIPATPEASPSA
jgi:basic membrane protein A and related proteins